MSVVPVTNGTRQFAWRRVSIPDLTFSVRIDLLSCFVVVVAVVVFSVVCSCLEIHWQLPP